MVSFDEEGSEDAGELPVEPEECGIAFDGVVGFPGTEGGGEKRPGAGSTGLEPKLGGDVALAVTGGGGVLNGGSGDEDEPELGGGGGEGEMLG